MAHFQDPSSSNWSFRPPSPAPRLHRFPNAPLEQPFSETLCGNYLSMLAQQPTDTSAGGDFQSPVYGDEREQDPAPGAADLYHEWCNEGDDDRSRYLTSPHTPLYCFTGATPSPSDTPLVTPDMGAGIDDIQGNFQDSDVALFGGLGVESVPRLDEYKPAAAAPKLPPTDHLWAFSPSTPALDSFEPVVPTNDPVIPYAKKRRASASKKVVAFVDDEEEEEEESRLAPPPPTSSEAQKIEYKRQMNTIAARRSRRRKAQHLQALEEKVKILEAKRVMWRENALTVQKMLRSRGIDFPFDDE